MCVLTVHTSAPYLSLVWVYLSSQTSCIRSWFTTLLRFDMFLPILLQSILHVWRTIFPVLPLNIVEGYIAVLHRCPTLLFCWYTAYTIDNDNIHNMYISVVGRGCREPNEFHSDHSHSCHAVTNQTCIQSRTEAKAWFVHTVLQCHITAKISDVTLVISKHFDLFC